MVITVKGTEHGGIMTSLAATGDMADEVFASKFYAGPTLPPPDLPPAEFWAAILGGVAGYLAGSL